MPQEKATARITSAHKNADQPEGNKAADYAGEYQQQRKFTLFIKRTKEVVDHTGHDHYNEKNVPQRPPAQ
jgi:hypothetical protein